jgi:hypothetical protein
MHKLIGFLIVVILFSSAIAIGQESFIEVIDMDNNTFYAKEIKIDVKGECELVTKTLSSRMNIKEMLSINFPSSEIKNNTQWEIALSSRDVICGIIAEGINDGIKVSSQILGSLDLNFKNLVSIKAPGFNLQKKTVTGDEDDIQFSIGDVDKGTIISIDASSVKLNSSIFKQEKNYLLKNISIINFAQIAPPPKLPEGVLGVIIGTDGTRLNGIIKKADSGTVNLKSVYGEDFNVKQENISRIYFKSARITYLSDIEPVSVKEYPTIYDPKNIFFPWKYKNDRNVLNTDLIAMKGKRFYKGLGVHANCELVYKLGEGYKRFIALAGIDDSAGPKATVQFVVYLDDKKVYESKVLKWGDNPVVVYVNIENGKELKLILNDGGDLHILDRAAWGDARLIK